MTLNNDSRAHPIEVFTYEGESGEFDAAGVAATIDRIRAVVTRELGAPSGLRYVFVDSALGPREALYQPWPHRRREGVIPAATMGISVLCAKSLASLSYPESAPDPAVTPRDILRAIHLAVHEIVHSVAHESPSMEPPPPPAGRRLRDLFRTTDADRTAEGIRYFEEGLASAVTDLLLPVVFADLGYAAPLSSSRRPPHILSYNGPYWPEVSTVRRLAVAVAAVRGAPMSDVLTEAVRRGGRHRALEGIVAEIADAQGGTTDSVAMKRLMRTVFAVIAPHGTERRYERRLGQAVGAGAARDALTAIRTHAGANPQVNSDVANPSSSSVGW